MLQCAACAISAISERAPAPVLSSFTALVLCWLQLHVQSTLATRIWTCLSSLETVQGTQHGIVVHGIVENTLCKLMPIQTRNLLDACRYVRLSISTCNVKRTAEDIRKAGGTVLRDTTMRTLKGQEAPVRLEIVWLHPLTSSYEQLIPLQRSSWRSCLEQYDSRWLYLAVMPNSVQHWLTASSCVPGACMPAFWLYAVACIIWYVAFQSACTSSLWPPKAQLFRMNSELPRPSVFSITQGSYCASSVLMPCIT